MLYVIEGGEKSYGAAGFEFSVGKGISKMKGLRGIVCAGGGYLNFRLGGALRGVQK